MARNGSGTYSLPVPPFTPGTTILSADVNSDFSDIATALTGSIAADGQTPITGQLKGAQGSVPTYSISGDLNTGFGSSSADTAYIQCGGVIIASYTSTTETVLALTVTNSATVGGTLSVTGNFGVTGNLLVNTNKFTVDAATGNTVVGGALGVSGTAAITGTLAVNTNKFTVDAATGNTVVAGTLGVTGNVTVNTNKFTVTASSGDTLVGGVLSVTGNIAASSSVLLSGTSGGVGYTTGAGGTVTQSTNKSTTVILNRPTGAITMNNATLNSGAFVEFTLTNSAIAANDVLVLNHISGGTNKGNYSLNAACAAGSALIEVHNIAGGSLSEAIVIQFAVIKSVTS